MYLYLSSFLQNTTGDNKGGSYSIRRKTSDMQQKWRKEITEDQLTTIQLECESTIKDLGFNLFSSVNATRNMSLPLFSDSKNEIFLRSKAN